MDWGLAAGAISRAVTDAEQGANQGMTQAQGVEAQRFGQGLQAQHLGLQQATLQNSLAQQAFNRGIAQANLGLHAQQLQNQRDQIEQMNRYHQGELGYRTALLPSQIAQHEATAGYYNTIAKQGGRFGMEERFKNGIANRMGYESYLDAPPEIQAQINGQFQSSRPFADQRTGLYNARMARYEDLAQHTQLMSRHLQQLMANPPASGEERYARDILMMRFRRHEQAMGRIARAKEAGQQPFPEDLAEAQANMGDIEKDFITLQNFVSARGAQQGYPGQTPIPVQGPPVRNPNAPQTPAPATGQTGGLSPQGQAVLDRWIR